MLTREENGWNFKAIKIGSALNIFPVEIDMQMGKIRRQSSKIRIFLWRILFCLAIAHFFYLFGRLVQSTIVEPEKYFQWDHFIMHASFAIGYSFWYYTAFCLFIVNPEESVLIFNQLFVQRENLVQKMMEQEKENERKRKQILEIKAERELRTKAQTQTQVPNGKHEQHETEEMEKQAEPEPETSSSSEIRPRPLLTWPPKYSLDELLAKLDSLICGGTVVFMVGILAFDPTRPQILYSSLPPEYQNFYSFCVLLAIEAVFVTFVFGLACFSVVSQLLFFGKCQQQFQGFDVQIRSLEENFQQRQFDSRDTRREIWILRQILKEIKELEVLIELFNRCFPPCIFAFKLNCLSCSILWYFFTIRHAQEFPLLAVFTGYFAILMTLLYGILYDKAFSIPEKMEELKNQFLLSAHKTTSTSTAETANRNKSFLNEMKREIERIRDVGIKVGSFHTLERESTPNFIDFVFQQVVDLLVTFE